MALREETARNSGCVFQGGRGGERGANGEGDRREEGEEENRIERGMGGGEDARSEGGEWR